LDLQDAVQALVEKINEIPMHMIPNDFVERLTKLAADIEKKRR
jgi:hypothetical protein